MGVYGVNVITSFFERREQKQILFERNALLDLTLHEIANDVRKRFMSFYDESLFIQQELEETCIDLAIEAYLVGASYSKFSFHGESEEQVLSRASSELKQFTDTLFDFWLFWSESEAYEKLYVTCELFLKCWWQVGFKKGERRYRMRLH